MTGKRERLDSSQLIDLVLDEGSWVSWDTTPERGPVSATYAEELARAAERTGVEESVVTGSATMRGRRIGVIVGEFGFLAGSIGVASARRVVAAVRRTTAEGLPLVAAPVSGGTRMQEGTPAFVWMVQISAAVAQHEAMLGFLGPRVYEAIHSQPFPDGVQTSESLYAHGLIDAVVEPAEIADLLDRTLTILLGLDHPVAARGPARRTPGAEVRRHRRRPPQRHRPGRVRRWADAGPGPVRGHPLCGCSPRTGVARPSCSCRCRCRCRCRC